MAKDLNERIAKGILSFMSGYSQAKAKGRELESDLYKTMMTEGIKRQYSPTEWKPQSMTEALNFERSKAGIVKPKEALGEQKTLLQIKGLENQLSEKEQQKEDATSLILDTAQENLNTVRAIKEGKKYFGPYANVPTLVTSLGGIVDYKNRKKWENNINKLLSQKVVDLITTMKTASKTGATGFGQLSEKEGQLLREASTALSKDLDPETAMYYLDQMENLYNKILSKKSSSGLDNMRPVNTSNARGLFTPKRQVNFTEEDIRYTMQKRGLSREEVLHRLGAL